MSANTNANYYAKVVATVLKNKSVMTTRCNKEYKDEFGEENPNGFKPGNTVPVSIPAIMTEIDGFVDGTDITGKYQGINEGTKQLSLDYNPIIPVEISDIDATLDLDTPESKAFQKRVLLPVAEKLSSSCDRRALKVIAETAFQVNVVEDFSASVLKDELKIVKALLAEQLAPSERMYSIVNTDFQNKLSSETEESFNPQQVASEAFKKGTVGSYANINFANSEILYVRTNGCGGVAGLALGADYVDGASTIQVVDGNNYLVGDKIVFDGGTFVNAQTKDSTGKDLVRAVKAINGNVLTIEPIYFTGSKQNASISGDAMVSGQTITGLGTSGKKYRCYPVYQEQGLVMVSVRQPIPKTVDKLMGGAAIDGVYVRMLSDFDISTAMNYTRNEILGLWSTDPRPEFVGVLEIAL